MLEYVNSKMIVGRKRPIRCRKCGKTLAWDDMFSTHLIAHMCPICHSSSMLNNNAEYTEAANEGAQRSGTERSQ
jgi:phage FluMu protein Com